MQSSVTGSQDAIPLKTKKRINWECKTETKKEVDFKKADKGTQTDFDLEWKGKEDQVGKLKKK